jgi:hypothetical protein
MKGEESREVKRRASSKLQEIIISIGCARMMEIQTSAAVAMLATALLGEFRNDGLKLNSMVRIPDQAGV